MTTTIFSGPSKFDVQCQDLGQELVFMNDIEGMDDFCFEMPGSSGASSSSSGARSFEGPGDECYHSGGCNAADLDLQLSLERAEPMLSWTQLNSCGPSEEPLKALETRNDRILDYSLSNLELSAYFNLKNSDLKYQVNAQNQEQAADHCETHLSASFNTAKKQRRPVGRPRTDINQKNLPCSGSSDKRRRGPKPKYIFATPQEAALARKERNRKSALESYYRRRRKLETLENEKKRLTEENKALETLLADIKSKGGCVLTDINDNGINAWLKQHQQ